MNEGFRKSFLNLFKCFKRIQEPRRRMSLGCPVATNNGAEGALLASSERPSVKRKNKTTRFANECREDSEHLEELSRQQSLNNFDYHPNYNGIELDDSIVDLGNGKSIK
jgi:hypothetical protein